VDVRRRCLPTTKKGSILELSYASGPLTPAISSTRAERVRSQLAGLRRDVNVSPGTPRSDLV
jgi:hypothetical protein